MRPFRAPPPSTALEPGPVPSFSIVIAAYQAADVIAEAIDSALGQTLAPLEVIVCDDGSTDDLAGALASHGNRITVLRKANGGEASAKNAAIGAARGDYVVILDADDVFAEDRLDALGELASARPDLDVLTTDAVLEIDGRVVRRSYEASNPFLVDDQRAGILTRNFVFGLCAVRRERLLAAGGFDEEIRYTTDWDLWLRMIFAGSRIGLVDLPLARYRITPANLSSQRSKMLNGALATLGKAAARDDLTPHERVVVEESVAGYRRKLALVVASESLEAGGTRRRRAALGVVLGAGQPLALRAKALAAALMPGAAARRTQRGDREVTAGLRVPRT